MLVGMKRHHQTIVFGCALLEDERLSSYIWLLNVFVDCMGNKKQVSIVIDRDRSMCDVIKEVLPNALHCLYC